MHHRVNNESVINVIPMSKYYILFYIFLMYITFTSVCEELSLAKNANLRNIVTKCSYQQYIILTMNMDNI